MKNRICIDPEYSSECETRGKGGAVKFVSLYEIHLYMFKEE